MIRAIIILVGVVLLPLSSRADTLPLREHLLSLHYESFAHSEPYDLFKHSQIDDLIGLVNDPDPRLDPLVLRLLLGVIDDLNDQQRARLTGEIRTVLQSPEPAALPTIFDPTDRWVPLIMRFTKRHLALELTQDLINYAEVLRPELHVALKSNNLNERLTALRIIRFLGIKDEQERQLIDQNLTAPVQVLAEAALVALYTNTEPGQRRSMLVRTLDRARVPVDIAKTLAGTGQYSEFDLLLPLAVKDKVAARELFKATADDCVEIPSCKPILQYFYKSEERSYQVLSRIVAAAYAKTPRKEELLFEAIERLAPTVEDLDSQAASRFMRLRPLSQPAIEALAAKVRKDRRKLLHYLPIVSDSARKETQEFALSELAKYSSRSTIANQKLALDAIQAINSEAAYKSLKQFVDTTDLEVSSRILTLAINAKMENQPEIVKARDSFAKRFDEILKRSPRDQALMTVISQMTHDCEPCRVSVRKHLAENPASAALATAASEGLLWQQESLKDLLPLYHTPKLNFRLLAAVGREGVKAECDDIASFSTSPYPIVRIGVVSASRICSADRREELLAAAVKDTDEWVRLWGCEEVRVDRKFGATKGQQLLAACDRDASLRVRRRFFTSDDSIAPWLYFDGEELRINQIL